MKTHFTLLLFLLMGAAIFAQSPEKHIVLETSIFNDSINAQKVQLIDVRTPEEYAEGHIPRSLNIDLYSDQFDRKFGQLDKQQPVYIYCRSGKRSGQAAEKLEAMGFSKIYDLNGGYLGYQKQIKP